MEHRFTAVIEEAVNTEVLGAAVEASFGAAAATVQVEVTVESSLSCEEISQEAAGWEVVSCGAARRRSSRALAAGTTAVLRESFATASDFSQRGIELPASLSIQSAEVEAVVVNSDAATGGDSLQNAMFDSLVSNLDDPQAFELESVEPIQNGLWQLWGLHAICQLRSDNRIKDT